MSVGNVENVGNVARASLDPYVDSCEGDPEREAGREGESKNISRDPRYI